MVYSGFLFMFTFTYRLLGIKSILRCLCVVCNVLGSQKYLDTLTQHFQHKSVKKEQGSRDYEATAE